MAIENFDEVKQYLEENKDNEEVKSLFTGFVPKEQLPDFADTDEGKKLLQPKLDKFFTKGLETWKANNLSKIVEDEVAKRNPAETPEQKQIRELRAELERDRREAQLAKIKANALKSLSEKKLPVGLVDYFKADTDEDMSATISAIEAEFNKALENAVAEKLKGKTPSGRQVSGGQDKLTQADVLAMSTADKVKLYKENPELFNKLMTIKED